MLRRALPIAFLLLVGACTTDSTPATTTRAPATTTTTTVSRVGLVPSPAMISAAAQSGDLSSTDADRLMALAMFSAPDLPIDYLVESGGAPGLAPWDHGALTRLLEAWDSLRPRDRVELARSIEGLVDLVDPGVSDRSAGCIEARDTPARVCTNGSAVDDASAAFESASAQARPWALDAVARAWASFMSLFGSGPALVDVNLTDLAASGAYAFHSSVDAGDVCTVYIDVLPPVGDGPDRDRIEAAVTHQLFHCFVRSVYPSVDGAYLEGAATWAEHHVFPEANTELPWLESWVTDPMVPFAERSYDTAFPFLFADLRGSGPGGLVAVLAADSIDRLDPSFGPLWQAISVAAWNQDPVNALVDDGAAIVGSPGDVAITAITPESEGAAAFELPMFSRALQQFEFSIDDDVNDFARLELDLSDVPDDVLITAIPETAGGWIAPVALDDVDWVFCRAAVGPCNDADTVARYTRIVLVVTNVDNGIERFAIPWNTFNPRLQGTWVRARGPISTVDTSPFWLLGTELVFDESASTMTEDAADSSFTNTKPGWSCALSGGYSTAADPQYGIASAGNVSGTVTVAGPTEGDGFTTECVVEDGATLPPISVPIFDEPGDTFGFEIRDYDTLWIYGDERIYLYQRAG